MNNFSNSLVALSNKIDTNIFIQDPASYASANFYKELTTITADKLFICLADSFDEQDYILEATIIGKLAVRLGWIKVELINSYQAEKARTTIAAQAVRYYEEFGVLKGKNDLKLVVVKGKRERRMEKFVKPAFDVEEHMSKSTLPVEIPGVLTSKRTKGDVAGRGTKLNALNKEFAIDYSSQAFELVPQTRDELLLYISNREDVKKKSSREGRTAKRERFEGYVDIYLSLVGKRLYQPIKFDKRGRLIGTVSHALLNTYGDHEETAAWQLADSEIINKDGFEMLVFAAVTLVDGRTSFKKALKIFNKEKFRIYQALDIMGLYERRLRQAFNDYNSGTPSKFLLGFDATNGGLQHIGVAFKDVSMLKQGNLTSLATPQDSHRGLRDAIHDRFGFDLERKRVKKLNTEFLHGSTPGSVAKHLNSIILEDIGEDSFKDKEEITEGEMSEVFAELLGDSADNIDTIASLGMTLYDEENLSLKWKMPDGFVAQSTNYFSGCRVKCYIADTTTKSGYSVITIARDMPALYLNGNLVYDKAENTMRGMRGLFANITHSIDSYVLRELKRRTNFVMMTKHDNFFTHPNNSKTVFDTYKEIMIENMDKHLYRKALQDVVRNHTTYNGDIPTLVYGEATPGLLKNATAFLMA